MISFIVKDALTFCGLIPPEISKTLVTQASKERLKTFDELYQAKKCRDKSQQMIEKLKNRVGKYGLSDF